MLCPTWHTVYPDQHQYVAESRLWTVDIEDVTPHPNPCPTMLPHQVGGGQRRLPYPLRGAGQGAGGVALPERRVDLAGRRGPVPEGRDGCAQVGVREGSVGGER